MNWYPEKQVKNHIIKTASLGSSLSTKVDWRGQAEDCIEFGNFQRYVCDSQTIKVFLTQTNNKIAVSLVTNHTYLGTAGWSIFWTFELNQQKEAKELFKVVSLIARETTEEFIREEKPSVLLHAVLRQKYKKLERKDVVRTNIPIINYSYDISYETDWRKSIYGPRYPTYKEVSFDKYLNKNIYSGKNTPTGKFSI